MAKTKLRKAEQDYVKKELDGCQNISNEWKVIRQCIPRREKTHQVNTKDLKKVADNLKTFSPL